MPHAVWALGEQNSTIDLDPRPLIPGVAPGMGIRNIFARRRTKPALMIVNAWAAILDIDQAHGAVDWNQFGIFLKLSQENDLTPGLLLPVAEFGSNLRQSDATGETAIGADAGMRDVFAAHGTIWAPRFVGIRLFEAGNITAEFVVHLDYEVVEIPFEEWFVKWDYLDNLVDNTLEY